jgi:hypothetical protein
MLRLRSSWIIGSIMLGRMWMEHGWPTTTLMFNEMCLLALCAARVTDSRVGDVKAASTSSLNGESRLGDRGCSRDSIGDMGTDYRDQPFKICLLHSSHSPPVLPNSCDTTAHPAAHINCFDRPCIQIAPCYAQGPATAMDMCQMRSTTGPL